MAHRAVIGLISAGPCAPPALARGRRPRGAKGAGIRYEKLAARALPSCLHNPWYQFRDANGPGLCSPDLVATAEGHVVVLECKLGNYVAADAQLRELYFPVLGWVYRNPVRGIILVRHLSRDIPATRVCTSLTSALARPPDTIPILHWLGRGPI